MQYTFLEDTFFNTYSGNNTFGSVDKISVGNTVTNVAANSTTVTVGNTMSINSGSVSIGPTMLVNSISVNIGSNVSVNTSIIKVGNVVSNTIAITTPLLISGNSIVNTSAISTPLLVVGNNTVNTTGPNFVRWQSGIATTNNMTLSTTSGLFYYCDISTTPVINLPTVANIPDGYCVTVRFNGVASTYQSAYIAAQSGKVTEYRGFQAQKFYVIGTGETFRFTWLNSQNLWMIECLVQPGQFFVTRTLTSASWNSGSGSFVVLPFNSGATTASNSAANGVINCASSFARTPIIGMFESIYRVYISSTAGGAASGTGYIISGNKTATNYDSNYAYKFQYYLVNEDYSYLEINWTTLYNSGEYSGAYHLETPTSIWYYPGNDYGRFELVCR